MKRILSSLILSVAAIGLFACGGSTPAATEKDYPADSLVAYLNENVSLQDGMSFEIIEFSAQNCRASVTVPEEIGKTRADVVGKGFCVLMAKWLSDKGYTVGHEGVYTSCYVYSPYVGVTGKDGMVISWGNARYDANSDAVEWKRKEK